jgi:hypothetical protein
MRSLSCGRPNIIQNLSGGFCRKLSGRRWLIRPDRCVSFFFSSKVHSKHFSKLGDTSLPLEQPEMLDDEFLKNLHLVLLEVDL